jgi:hypothetical protein
VVFCGHHTIILSTQTLSFDVAITIFISQTGPVEEKNVVPI